MLEFATWRDEPRDRESVIRLLESKGIEPTEALIELQCCFGGLEYSVRGYYFDGWSLEIADCEFLQNEKESLLVFALFHRTNQVYYAIDQAGLIYESIDFWGTINPENSYYKWQLYTSSFFQLIESDALIDELMDVWGNGVQVSCRWILPSISALEEQLTFFDNTLSKIVEASGMIHTNWSSSNLRIYASDFESKYYPRKRFMRVFAKSLEIAQAFMAHLIDKGVLTRQSYLFQQYPYIKYPNGVVYKGFP